VVSIGRMQGASTALVTCLAVIAACESSTGVAPPTPAPPTPPACRDDPRRPTRCDVRVDQLPALPDTVRGRYDATVSAALRQAFGTHHVRSCGVLEREAPIDDIEASRDCVGDALATRHPFAEVQSVHGIDSAVSDALVGLVRDGQFTVYELRYDGDPCGGSCSELGGTTLWSCARMAPSSASCTARSIDLCFDCVDRRIEDSWHTGAINARSLADTERILPRILGTTLASRGPLLSGISFGVLAEPTITRLAEADAEANASGIVTLEEDKDGRQLYGLGLRIAGPCRAIRDRAAAAWGNSTDDSWLDPATHQRAYLDRTKCILHFEPYVELADWLSETSQWFALGIVGTRASALRERIGRSHQITGGADDFEWTDTSIGRRGGGARFAAHVERGRILELEVSANTDPATVIELHDRLVALLGKPFQDDTINAGATRYAAWRGTRDIELSFSDGSFELSVGKPRR